MQALQPAFVTPLVAPDPRLIQYARFSFSHEYTANGNETTNYGNCRGAGMIAGKRLELDWVPPSYFQHSSSAEDGPGDTYIASKFRIASGTAEGGNYEVAALLSRSFPIGSHSNGAQTASWAPTFAFGRAFGHFDAISTLGATLPEGKVAEQGQPIAWNVLTQAHASAHFWVEIENNAMFFEGGPHDGRMQNFLTPAAFYVARRASWRPSHPSAVFSLGMQIATSSFHTYNHNLIAEMRILF